MASYFLAFSWGICILLSLIGWGGLINSILFPKYQIDWGQRAAWGIAFSVLVGGILNATWTISKPTILIYLTLGLLYELGNLFKSRHLLIQLLFQHIRDCQKDWVVLFGTFIILCLSLLHYAGSFFYDQDYLNFTDDFHAYFVFPNKMLQMGSMGPDPFSARRLEWEHPILAETLDSQ